MTINYTNFVNLMVQAFPDFVTDIDTSTYQAQLDTDVLYSVQNICSVQEVQLDALATYTINIPGLSTGWYLLAITCTAMLPTAGFAQQALPGQGYITTTGTDQDGTTPITGKIPLYGALLPSGPSFQGIVYLSTQNMTANPVITSQQNGSLFQVFVMSLVPTV